MLFCSFFADVKIGLETKSPCNPENLFKKAEGKKTVLLWVNIEPEWDVHRVSHYRAGEDSGYSPLRPCRQDKSLISCIFITGGQFCNLESGGKLGLSFPRKLGDWALSSFILNPHPRTCSLIWHVYGFERERKGSRGGRGEGRERNRTQCERETDWLPPFKCPDWDSAQNLGLCPDWESALQPVVSGDAPARTAWPGLHLPSCLQPNRLLVADVAERALRSLRNVPEG